MSRRDLAMTCLERLMAVERYYESQHPLPAPAARPSGPGRPDHRSDGADRRDRAPGPRPDRPAASRPA
jgi:hypothetical protein